VCISLRKFKVYGRAPFPLPRPCGWRISASDLFALAISASSRETETDIDEI